MPLLLAVQSTWLGRRVLNNFQWFRNTHLLMFVLFMAAVILHPWPAAPGRAHHRGNSITWVRPWID